MTELDIAAIELRCKNWQDPLSPARLHDFTREDIPALIARVRELETQLHPSRESLQALYERGCNTGRDEERQRCRELVYMWLEGGNREAVDFIHRELIAAIRDGE